MKLFIQSASLAEIRRAADWGLVDGVVLSPVDVAADDPSVEVKDRLAEISAELAVPVCVPVSSIIGGDVYRDGRELARASDQVIVQVPFLEDAITPIRKLVADGVPICATHVFSGAQAFLAAKIGATMISVSVEDVDVHGRPSAELVEQLRNVIDTAGLECDLAVTPAANATCFTDYLLAGADTACVTPSLLASLVINSLTDRGVDRFLSELSKRRKPRAL